MTVPYIPPAAGSRYTMDPDEGITLERPRKTGHRCGACELPVHRLPDGTWEHDALCSCRALLPPEV